MINITIEYRFQRDAADSDSFQLFSSRKKHPNSKQKKKKTTGHQQKRSHTLTEASAITDEWWYHHHFLHVMDRTAVRVPMCHCDWACANAQKKRRQVGNQSNIGRLPRKQTFSCGRTRLLPPPWCRRRGACALDQAKLPKFFAGLPAAEPSWPAGRAIGFAFRRACHPRPPLLVAELFNSTE